MKGGFKRRKIISILKNATTLIFTLFCTVPPFTYFNEGKNMSLP
jgi:hypothetical protein